MNEFKSSLLSALAILPLLSIVQVAQATCHNAEQIIETNQLLAELQSAMAAAVAAGNTEEAETLRDAMDELSRSSQLDMVTVRECEQRMNAARDQATRALSAASGLIYSHGGRRWGGDGGNAFDDSVPLYTEVARGNVLSISKIKLRSGGRVDQVGLVYSNGLRVTHGGSGGTASSIDLPSNTTLQEVEVCKAYTSKHKSTTVHYVQFVLSNGATLSGGSRNGECVTLKSNKGYPIAGFYGTSGGEVDSLGIVIEKTSREAVTGNL